MSVLTTVVSTYCLQIKQAAVAKKIKVHLRNFLLMDTSQYNLIPFLITNNRIWSKIRSSENWESIVNKKYNDQDWIENFRMTKGFV